MTDKIEGWTLERTVGPDPHLTQGDLILFHDSDDPLKRAGIVVTADCDLKNRKHAQLATLVPIVSVQATMECYLLIEACESQRKNILEFACRKQHIDLSEDPFVVDAQMRELSATLQDGTPEKLAIDFILRRQESMSVKQYAVLMTAAGSQPKGASSFEQQLLKKGDIVVLPSAAALGVTGEIAWVRHIWQESIGQIALKTSDVKHCRGERVARLDSPYRYRLTQVMAQVFSDIGLPDSEKQFKTDIEKVLSNV